MLNQIKLLTCLQTCDLGGMNQIKYGKDKKKKRRFIALGIVYAILSVFVALYSGFTTYAYVSIGMQEISLLIIMLSISIISLLFTIYKAGSIIFNMQTYETLITLPVSSTSIVISRFLTMYIQNIGFSAVLIIPATLVYGFMLGLGFLFYLSMLLSILLIPLIPMVLATVIGSIITAISSRMKHKNIVTTIIIILLISTIFIVPMFFNNGMIDKEILLTEALSNLGNVLEGLIYSIYPLSQLFIEGIMGNIMNFFIFTTISVGAFIIMVVGIKSKFVSICSAIYSKQSKNNYKVQDLKTTSPLSALYRKEMRMYFSSSIYVTNTIVGYLLMLIFSAVFLFTNIKDIEAMIGFNDIQKFIPFILALICSLTPTTVSSISMEGKYWWLSQSLPIDSKLLFNSKILVCLTIALPFYIIAQLLLFIGLELTLLQRIWMLFIPFIYIIFSAVLGITLNRKLPVFDWKSDVTAVKQGGALLMSMLISFVSASIPIFLLLTLSNISDWIILGIILILSAITVYLYKSNNKINIASIK